MKASCLGKVLAAQLVLGVVAAVLLLVALKQALSPNSTLVLQSQLRLKAPSGASSSSLTVQSVEFNRVLREKSSKPTHPVAAASSSSSASTATVPPSQLPRQHKTGVYNFAHRYGDLPALRLDHSPKNPAWDNGIAICACMFQENTTDVREWLLYHKWLGVDHIYLTENSEPAPEGMLPALQEFIDEGFVTFNTAAKPAFQQTIYVDCMQQHRHKHNWMAFIDLDEFIVLRKKGVTLKEFLNDYKEEASLVMHWVVVGASDRATRPPEGGVLRAYRHCQANPSPVVKSITNTFNLANMVSSPHTFEYRNNEQSVDEHYNPMPWRYDLPAACTDGTIVEPDKELDCRPVPHVQKRPASADSIAVFHYITKSREDFELKSARGGGGGSHRTWEHFNRVQKDASSKGGLCDEAFKVADDCCNPNKYVAAPQQISSTTPDKAAKQESAS